MGEDTGTPVSLDYDVPFRFDGTVDKLVVNLQAPKLSAADLQKIEKGQQGARAKVE